MTAAVDDFAELIRKARTGDAAAISEIVRRYEPEVRLVARLRLGAALRPYLDSVDLVQSVHKSLIRGLQDEKFEIARPEQLVALALTMVRRKAAKAWRKLQRQKRPGDAGDSLPDVLVNLITPQTDPAEEVAFRDAVERLCRDLEPLDKQLLEKNLQGYRTAEIARELGVSGDLLRVRLSRLRAKLRAAGIAEDW
jgi:RNA polymerase sigma-70 factor (ECF subfamily)